MDDLEKLQAVHAKLREAAAILATVPGAELIVYVVLDQLQFVDVMTIAEEDL